MTHALPGFRSFETHHCVTGSMLHVLRHRGVEVSEEMLLGLGAGVGFFYWHTKGAPPMLLGRGNTHRGDVVGLEVDAPRRLGIGVERVSTSSAKFARASLDEELAAGRSVMVQVDMGFLPYLDFPEEYHFGGHVVVVGGVDRGRFVVADRDAELHRVTQHALAMARGSRHKPFPAKNTWYRFDTSAARPPTPADMREAIHDNADAMLNGPITNLGVRGIRKAARLVARWPTMLDDQALRWACINNFIFIDATGGTGGGMFRMMYGRFLHEVADLTGAEPLRALGDESQRIGDAWQEVAATLHASSEDGVWSRLADLSAPLLSIADREEALWQALDAWATAAE